MRDLSLTTDLGTLVAQFARRSHEGFASSVSAAAEAKTSQDKAEAQTALITSLERAREGLIRLSILVHASKKDHALVQGLEEASRVQKLRHHANLMRRCAERDRMGRDRESLVAGLASRQHDVETAAAVLCLCGGESSTLPGDFSNVGWPPSVGSSARADQEELALDLCCRIAESKCCKDPSSLSVEILQEGKGVQFTSPGSFSILASCDFRQVLEATACPLQAKGVNVGKEGQQMFHKRLQAALARHPGDPPDVLCSTAHAFCSHMWLCILYNGALKLPLAKRAEMSLVKWDQRKGVLKLRICQNWDPTCGDVLEDEEASQAGGAAAGPVTEDLQMNASSETLMSRDKSAARVGGAVLQLAADPAGGLSVTSHPELDIGRIAPPALEEHGIEALAHIQELCHHALALRHFTRLRDVLLSQVASPLAVAGGGHSGASIEGGEVLPDEPALRMALQGCAVELRMDSTGHLGVRSESWCEPASGGGIAEGLLRGREGFIARLQAARWHSLCAAVEAVATELGWTATEPLASGVDSGGQSAAVAVRRGPGKSEEESRWRTFRFRSGGTFVLSFELRDGEVVRPSLAVWPRSPQEDVLPVSVDLAGLRSFAFAPSTAAAGAIQGITALREGVQRLLQTAQAAVDKLPVSARILEHLAQHAADLGLSSTSAVGSWSLNARVAGAGLEGELSFSGAGIAGLTQARSLPFVAPVRITVDEKSQRWTIGGTLQQEIRLVPEEDPTRAALVRRFRSGGFFRPTVAADGRAVREAILEYWEGGNSGKGDSWQHWTTDLRSVAVFTSLAAQACCGMPNASLELCRPGRLQLRLQPIDAVGASSGAQGDLVELVWPEREAIAAAESPLSSLPCVLKWVEPSTPFLLADELSQLACRSVDLSEVLRYITTATELVRVVQDLQETDKVWAVRGLGPTALSVEFKQQAYCPEGHPMQQAYRHNVACVKCAEAEHATHNCSRGCDYCVCTACFEKMSRESRVLGVRLEALLNGKLKCSCMSHAYQKGDPRMGLLPNFEAFASGQLSSAPGPAGSPVSFRPGRLASALSPLWAYLRSYHTLWGVYAMMTMARSQRSVEQLGQEPRLGLEASAVSNPGDRNVTWAHLTVGLAPAVADSGCVVKLVSRKSSGSRQHGGREGEPPSKRSRGSEELSASTEVFLYFQTITPVPQEHFAELPKPPGASGELFGLSLLRSSSSLTVKRVDEDLKEELLQRNPEAVLQPGDEIVEVNGIRGSAVDLFEEYKRQRHLRLVWLRRSDGERVVKALGRYDSYFQRLLSPKQRLAPRASLLQPALKLLGAPALWMLEEAAQLLPPLPGAAEAWETLPQCFEVANLGDGGAGGDVRWQLTFALAPKATSRAARPPSSAARRVTCQGIIAHGQSGWDALLVDGMPFAEWAGTLPDGCNAKMPLLRAVRPFALAKILGPLVEGLGAQGMPAPTPAGGMRG